MDAANLPAVYPFKSEDALAYGDLLPAQYYDIVAGRRRGDGARDLMLAVLEDGIRCYVTNIAAKTARRRRLHDEAKSWIDTRGDVSPFSFESICETFDIDADALRRQLAAAPPRMLRRIRTPKTRRRVLAHA